jgi:O-antigen/teichoic acid export membrane protein
MAEEQQTSSGKSILKKTVAVSIGNFSHTFQRLGLTFFLSRLLSQYDYGTYQQVWLFYGLVSEFFILGIPGGLLYFIPRLDRHRHKTLVLQNYLLLGVIGVIFAAATWISAEFVAQRFNNPALGKYLQIFCIYPILALPTASFTLLLVAEDRSSWAAIYSWLQTILFIFFALIPAFLKMDLAWILWAINVYTLVLFLLVIGVTMKMYQGIPYHWDFGIMRGLLAYSIPLGLSGSLTSISKLFDRAIISFLYPPDRYAIYVNGAFEVPFIELITGSLMTVLIPEFVKMLKDGKMTKVIWELWSKAAEKTALAIFPITVFLIMFSEDTIILLFSEKYLASTPVFVIYLLITPMRIVQYGVILRAIGRSELILWISIGRLVFDIGLGIAAALVIGFLGPAIEYVVMAYVMAGTYLLVIVKITKINFSKIMPWSGLVKIMTISICAGVAALPVLLWIKMPLLRLSIGGICYSLAYVALLIIFRLLSLKTLQALGLSQYHRWVSYVQRISGK